MSNSFAGAIPQVTVEQLAQHLEEIRDRPTSPIQLIDVREPSEVEMASLPGFKNYPLGAYGDWAETILKDLDPTQETLVLCHHGMRSAQMCQWLVNQGFTNVKNITGGIDAYSMLVDRSVPRY